MRYAADPSRDTMATLRSFASLSSRLTMRSNTCGGGPSIDSNATVAPPPADANALPAAPPLAHPPSAPPNPHGRADTAGSKRVAFGRSHSFSIFRIFRQDRSMRAYLLTGYGAVADNVRLAE